MSTSDLYLLFGKSVRHWSEHRNGWGSAPLCWDYLGEKYIPDYNPMRWRDVWPLNGDERLSEAERASLLFTLDRAFIPKADLETAADWFGEFAAMTEREPSMNGRANHWREFADSVRAAKAIKDKRLRGVCLSCTSVSDPWSWATPDDFVQAWPITAQGTSASGQDPQGLEAKPAGPVG